MTSRPGTHPSAAALVRSAVPTATIGLGLLVAVAVTALTALPASAAEGLGDRKPSGLSALQTFLIFAGIPILVFAVVIALVYATSRNNEPRLREGQSWWTEPDYNTRESIGVQTRPDDAEDAAADSKDAPRTTDGGGTSAGW